ncbi:MAG: hypothetical protein ACYCW6_13430 [Candidatus Xenobia bacterium]
MGFSMRRAAIVLFLLLASLPLWAQDVPNVDWNVEYASQDQPGWVLANSQVLFSDEGCYVTSLWMLKHADGEFRGTLGDFNRWLAEHKACEPNGDLRLWMQDELGVVRIPPSPQTLDRILAQRPVIVKSALNGGHFYVVVGRQGDCYLCDDPGVAANVRRSYEELEVIQLRDMPTLGRIARY